MQLSGRVKACTLVIFSRQAAMKRSIGRNQASRFRQAQRTLAGCTVIGEIAECRLAGVPLQAARVRRSTSHCAYNDRGSHCLMCCMCAGNATERLKMTRERNSHAVTRSIQLCPASSMSGSGKVIVGGVPPEIVRCNNLASPDKRVAWATKLTGQDKQVLTVSIFCLSLLLLFESHMHRCH